MTIRRICLKHYDSYMDRQHLSQSGEEKLLALEHSVRKKRPLWQGGLALAACCVLVAGLARGFGGKDPGPSVPAQDPAGSTPPQSSAPAPAESTSPQEQGQEQAMMFLMVPYVNYQPLTFDLEPMSSIALAEGSFHREVGEEDLIALFRGAEGKLPAHLFWDDYDLSGWVTYSAGGDMLWMYVLGEHPNGSTFELELAPGRLPLTCLQPGEMETTDVFGTPVAGWSHTYDRNGDGAEDHICGVQFMAGDVGVRFENGGSPCGGAMETAAQFNALFVRQALSSDGGLELDHLLHTDDVPGWRDAEFSSLTEARQEKAYAPYLPEKAPVDWPGFFGRLTWQEGLESTLFVRWSRGYDNVEVMVYLPEGERDWTPPVDVTRPESYDTRLYTIPWCDSVPEEYVLNFYMPHFRAEDMSLAVVETRVTEKDTGGAACRFGVVHPDGTVVHYSCDGITAAQVWAMVEPTLTGNS